MEHNIDQLLVIISEYEKKLNSKSGGDIADKLDHVLRSFNSIADNAIWQAKEFLEDSKTQYKALEIIVDGLTSDGMNHSQKRVIANHIITMLRSMVDKLDKCNYEYTTNIVDRYNFFRSTTPERRVYEERSRLSAMNKNHEAFITKLKEQHPDIYEKMKDELPF